MDNSKIKPDMHAFMRELVKEVINEKDISEESLRTWFGRKGAPGKKGGWVDCNAPKYKDGKKIGYKSCGRGKGEKRSKYPACRPTASQCSSKGKGKTWGKTKNETANPQDGKAAPYGSGFAPLTKEQLIELVKAVLTEKKKKKKKKKVKKDACYHKVKRNSKVWPSAYASGRLVQCREKGAKNWGNKTEHTMNKSELKNLITKVILESYRHKDMLGYKIQEAEENNEDLQVKVGKYNTEYFHVCPGAKALYDDIKNKVDDMEVAERAAKLQDALFFIEQHVLEDYNEDVPEGYTLVAENLAEQIMAMASMMGLSEEHDYIQMHVDKIKAAI